jgi:hypothetical protein
MWSNQGIWGDVAGWLCGVQLPILVVNMHMTWQMRLTFVSSDGLREMRQLNLLSKGIFFENSL